MVSKMAERIITKEYTPKPHNENDEIENVSFGRPHVVILGAGASKAAFPSGDRYEKQLPLMNDLIDIVGLDHILKKHNIQYKDSNFENLYSSFYGKAEYLELVIEIEKRVFDYFSTFKMPYAPTLYDHLVLCLRPKDLIATFNWDPFLYWSLCRNYRYADMPYTLYLHGNVGVGYCNKDKTMGRVNQRCSKCGALFERIPLLYPVENKNYTSHPFIQSAWQEVRKAIGGAYILTIFGYSAPQTDIEAIKLLKEGWGDVNRRSLEEVEIIDIKSRDEKSRDELHQSWEPFIHSHHYRTTDSFYKSFMAKHPRRSCEAMWECLMNVNPYQDRDMPKGAPFNELWDWFKPLVEAERKSNFQRHAT